MLNQEEWQTGGPDPVFKKQMTLQEGYNCFMEVPAFRISEPGIHQIKIRALDQEKSFTVTAVQSTTYGKDGATLKKALCPVDKDGFQDNNRSENTIVLTGRYLNTVSRLVRKDSDITEETIASYLRTNFMPDPDLLIRTGGELRLSNYLLWQCAYTELYFCDTYWPDFDEEEFCKAIYDYQQRERRYGKTSEQI